MKITADELKEVLNKLPNFDIYPHERFRISTLAASPVSLTTDGYPLHDEISEIEFYKDHREKKWRLS